MHSTTETLVVSSSDDILTPCKVRGNFTCRYRYVSYSINILLYKSIKVSNHFIKRAGNDLFGQVTTDYIATTPTEIKDVIEDLNGIAFRDSVVKF